MTNKQKVRFAVGNRYRKVPYKLAKETTIGKMKKVHDWQIYVDVFGGSKKQVKNVSFDYGNSLYPSPADCNRPAPIRQRNGGLVWRFFNHRKTYAPVKTNISIQFTDGSKAIIPHRVVCKQGGSRLAVKTATQFVTIPSEQWYGIELELTTMTDEARLLELMSNCEDKTFEGWELERDGSIACSRLQPNCTKFELVSPVLKGETGLFTIRRVLEALQQNNIELKVNRSMGFHVHVNVKRLSQQQLNKVCQNFVKYEDVFDSFLPWSRKTGSSESNRYFKSNRDAMREFSNRERNEILENCQDLASLAELMNPKKDRYYKLNLQNLVTKKQDTLEFRQHSATNNPTKIINWVRFCVLFVRNSADLPSPLSLREDRSLQFQTEALFKYLVKDVKLKDYYLKRQRDVHEKSCCDACRNGQHCTEIVLQK